MMKGKILKLATAAVTTVSAIGLTGLAATASAATATHPDASTTAALAQTKVNSSPNRLPAGKDTADTSASPNSADTCGPSNAWVAVLGNSFDIYFCGVATENTSQAGTFTDMTSNVENRIWFHQDANGGGWGDCFRGPGSWKLTGRDQHPGNIQVSANKNPC
jgi:hypothetical protein